MNADNKTTVLFVDDEPLVLRGLQRMLRPLAREWDMAFVESGSQALEAMSKTPYSVVVTDMRMPGMNGAQLLGEISKNYPKSVRIILSGHADKNLIVQCIGTRPVPLETLRTRLAKSGGRARQQVRAVGEERNLEGADRANGNTAEHAVAISSNHAEAAR